MIDQDDFIAFLHRHFAENAVDIQRFASGCTSIDVHLNESDVLCIFMEPGQIGLSYIQDYTNFFDLSTFSDHVFETNGDAEDFVLHAGK